MKKKFLAVFIITLLAMCNYTNVFAQETIKTKETVAPEDDVVIDTPRIVYFGCETSLDVVYSVWLNDEHITLGTGYMSSTLEEAISNPLVIESAGYSICLLLENIDSIDDSEEIILHPGYVGSICYNSNYLYVIVSGESRQEVYNLNDVPEECEEENKEKTDPKLLKEYKKPGFLQRSGTTFTASADGYGVIASGHTYSTIACSLLNPIVIDSGGHTITISVTTHTLEVLTKQFDSSYEGCVGDLYVIITSPN